MNRIPNISPLSAMANAGGSGAAATQSEFGALPEWNLDDLYPGMTSQSFKDDFDEAVAKAKAFEKAHKGKLAAKLDQGGDALGEAIAGYEKLEAVARYFDGRSAQPG